MIMRYEARRLPDNATWGETWGVCDTAHDAFVLDDDGRPIEFSFEHNARIMARVASDRDAEAESIDLYHNAT